MPHEVHQCLWLWNFMKYITHKVPLQKLSKQKCISVALVLLCFSEWTGFQHLWPLWSWTSLQSSTRSLRMQVWHMLMRLCLKDCQAAQIRRRMGNSQCQPAGQTLKGIPCRLEHVAGRQFALDCQKPLVSLIYLLDLGFSLVFWGNETAKASWFLVIYVGLVFLQQECNV